MALAFVLAHFGLWDVASFAMSHIFALSGLGLVGTIVAAVLLYIFVPGSVMLIRTALGVVMKGLTWLISTTAAAFVIVALVCLALGFGAGRFLDKSIALQQQLEAQVKATDAERAAAEAAQEAAAKVHLQAAALDAAAGAASRRAESAEAQRDDMQEQVDDYAAQLAAAEKAATPAKPVHSYALTAADVAALARIGAPRQAKHR